MTAPSLAPITIDDWPTIAPLALDPRGYPIPFISSRDDEPGEIVVQLDPVFGEKVAMLDRPWKDRGLPLPASFYSRYPARLGRLNPGRQRWCMYHRRCSICGTKTSAPWRFITGASALLGYVTEPSLCPPCLDFSIRVCPKLLYGEPLVLEFRDAYPDLVSLGEDGSTFDAGKASIQNLLPLSVRRRAVLVYYGFAPRVYADDPTVHVFGVSREAPGA